MDTINKREPTKIEFIFVKIGLFFGEFVARLLEKLLPFFRDKEYPKTFYDSYLEKFNLPFKERFKREIKMTIIITFSLFFYVSISLILYDPTLFFKKEFYPIILFLLLAVFVFIFLLGIVVAYIISLKTKSESLFKKTKN